MNLKNSQYQAIMRQYDLRQLQHRHLQSQRYQEICDRLPAYRQLEEETASFCADRARAAALALPASVISIPVMAVASVSFGVIMSTQCRYRGSSGR